MQRRRIPVHFLLHQLISVVGGGKKGHGTVEPLTRPRFLGAVLLLLAIFVAQAVSLAMTYSQTHDEAVHTLAGLLYLRTGVFEGGDSNPPLLATLFGLPYHLGLATWDMRHSVAPPLAARLVNVALGVGLGLIVLAFADRLHGRQGALLALALYVTSPSFVAHSALATTDVGATFLMTAALLLLFVAHERQSWPMTTAAAAVFGLALAGKFTAFLLVPPVLVLMVLHARSRPRPAAAFFVELLLVFVVVWSLFCAAYRFRGTFSPKDPGDLPVPTALAYVTPTKGLAAIQAKYAELDKTDATSMFFGRLTKSSFWYYYPIVGLAKMPPGTLAVLAVFIVLLARKELRPAWRHRYAWGPPAVMLLYLTAFNDAQSGTRHLFPCFALLYVSLGALATAPASRPRLPFLLAGAVLLNAASLAVTHPQQLSYFNAAAWAATPTPFVANGPDTNYGQDEFLLERALAELPEDLPILVAPAPSSRPVAGYIVVNPDHLYLFVGATAPYDWLRDLVPLRRVGGSWLIYRVTEHDLRERAEHPTADVTDCRRWLTYLLGARRYGELLAASEPFVHRHPSLLLLRGQARLLSDDVEGAAREFATLATTSRGRATAVVRWLTLCAELLNKARGSPDEQLVRAILSLDELVGATANPLKKRLLAAPPFDGPVPLDDPRPMLRYWKGLQLISNHDLDGGLAYLESCRGRVAMPYLDRSITVWQDIRRRLASRDLRTRLKVVHNHRYRLLFPRRCVDQVLAAVDEHPDDFLALRYLDWLYGYQRRGILTTDLGRDSLYDRIEPGTRRYRRSVTNPSTASAAPCSTTNTYSERSNPNTGTMTRHDSTAPTAPPARSQP